MGYFYNRLKRARPVLAVGILFALIGNIVYMFIESVPYNRKWVMFAARFLTGLGGGTGGTIRAYIGMASTVEQRGRAIAIGTAAISLGATAGPLIQTCVTPIGYPGVTVGPFHLSQYTAVAYVSVVCAVVLLVLLFSRFKENYVGIDEGKKTNPFHFVPKFNKAAAFLCIFAWFTVYFCRTNSDSVESPYTIAVFNWTNDEAVRYNSIIMACSSIFSFLIYIPMAIYGHRINERAAIISGLCMLCAFYAVTFPWPFFTGHLTFKSLTTDISTDAPYRDAGCDADMEWCNYTPRLPLPLYLVAYPMLAAGLPVCNVAISTLFSKILGPRRQGFMQSLMVMAGSSARLFGPILISWLFSKYGPRIAWTMTATVVAICICTLLAQFNRLVPLNVKPTLTSGQKVRYDGGILYHL